MLAPNPPDPERAVDLAGCRNIRLPRRRERRSAAGFRRPTYPTTVKRQIAGRNHSLGSSCAGPGHETQYAPDDIADRCCARHRLADRQHAGHARQDANELQRYGHTDSGFHRHRRAVIAGRGIAGRGIANPVATILSVAMMLDWFQSPRRAGLIRRAVRWVFYQKEMRTAEMGGRSGTRAMADAILEAMAKDGGSI